MINLKPTQQNFTGISGTATKIKNDGTKEEVKFSLPDDNVSLIIAEDPYGKFGDRLLLVRNANEATVTNYLGNANCSNIKIDRIDKNSAVNNSSPFQLSINTMADKAKYYAKNSYSETWIDAVEGKDTKIALTKGAKLHINSDADFRLKTSNFGPDLTRVICDSFLDIIG